MHTQSHTIHSVVQALEAWAPPALQATYDNSGYQVVVEKERAVEGILTTLDITLGVLKEAKKKGCNLVISHHPLIFPSLKCIENDATGAMIAYALAHEIALYTLHTNLDMIRGGVNDALADQLLLEERTFLSPKGGMEGGVGLKGHLKKALSGEDFLQWIQNQLALPAFRYSQGPQKKIEKVALVGGVGAPWLTDAIAQGVDAFITGDLKYHNFLSHKDRLWLLDIGHYASEKRVKEQIAAYISNIFPKMVVEPSLLDTNPIQYYV